MVYNEDFDLCADMKCPLIIKPLDCIPSQCKRLDDKRKQVGAIYMVRPDGEESDFVAMLPMKKQ